MEDGVLRRLERMLERQSRKIRNCFARGVLKLTGDSHKLQSLQVQLLDGELLDGAERAQQYGFTSHPQAGAEVFVAFVGGDRGHAVVLSVDDRRYRVQSLEGGEVCLYSDEGDTIIFRRGNRIEVKTKHWIVRAEDDYTVETKNFSVQAADSVDIKTSSTRIATDALSFSNRGGGDVTAQMTGTLAASGDVTANQGGVSLRGHQHDGVQPGSGTSQKPVGG